MKIIKKKINYFNKSGYLIIKNVFKKKFCEKIKKKLEFAIIKENSFHKRNGFRNFSDKNMVMNCAMYGTEFIKILDNKKFINLVNSILGKNSILYAYTSSSLAPGEGNFSSRMHVDCPRFINNFVTNVGCIIALDDFTMKNGGTEFLPCSHLKDKTPNKKFFDKHKIVLEIKKGSVFYFHGRLFHKGGINLTNNYRHALSFNFCRPWMKQRYNFYQMLSRRVNIINLSKNSRQKLGFFSRPPNSLNEYYGYKCKRSFTQSVE